jgi:hypothetical protein
MRVFIWAVPGSLAALVVPVSAASAQSMAPSVDQRLTAPTSQADAYMGVSLGQLLLALGLTLRGAPHGLDDIRLMRTPQVAAAPPLATAADKPAGDAARP